MLFTSPRSTAPYQMLQSRPTVTSPISTAVSARNVPSPTTGTCPRTSLIIAIFPLRYKISFVWAVQTDDTPPRTIPSSWRPGAFQSVSAAALSTIRTPSHDTMISPGCIPCGACPSKSPVTSQPSIISVRSMAEKPGVTKSNGFPASALGRTHRAGAPKSIANEKRSNSPFPTIPAMSVRDSAPVRFSDTSTGTPANSLPQNQTESARKHSDAALPRHLPISSDTKPHPAGTIRPPSPLRSSTAFQGSRYPIGNGPLPPCLPPEHGREDTVCRSPPPAGSGQTLPVAAYRATRPASILPSNRIPHSTRPCIAGRKYRRSPVRAFP